ncbi:glycosyltransferase [Phycicoccus jejuensis]|uniref:glycosyltransferase n=1 Tax=Phycicoccus jejuensis TaxID=367299 RepID=UPI00384DBB56
MLAARFRDLSAEVGRLRRTARAARTAEARAKKLEAENAALTRRLGSASSSLDAYRAETARLKDDLKRLRGSRAYRLGRGLGTPLALVRAMNRAGTRTDTPLALPPAPTASAATPTKRLRDHSLEELLERFRAHHDPERLGHVLSRSWYEQGDITTAADLLRAHPDVSAGLAGHPADLAQRILGAHRVMAEGLPVPGRAPGAAYLPEPGRVLYCAHSTPAFNSNGYSVRTRGLVSGLRDAGVDVVVAARSGYPWDTKTDRRSTSTQRTVVDVGGVPYVHHPGSRLTHTPLDHYVLECADAFVREARLQRPALIHAASNHVVGLAALIAARRVGVPFVYEVRGLWEVTEASEKPGWDDSERFALQVRLETLVAAEADAVLVITEQTRDELVRRGVDPELITVTPNAVDPHELLPLPRDGQYATKRGVRTDVPVIGFAGSLVSYEGLDVLLEAADVLRRDGLDFQVVIAGDGPAAESLAAQADSLGLRDHVSLLGRVPSDEIPRLLSLFDVMPCPRRSLPVTEMVSPLKPLEAMAAAKAVVLSDVAPHRDLAGAHEERARLVPAGDAVALADVLRELLTDADARADLGRAGRLWCLDERSWVRIADTIGVAHRRATARSKELSSGGRRLASLRVGLIADEFTTETLSASLDVVPLDRHGWRDQLDGLDLMFVESAWKGNGGGWHRGVGQYDEDEHADVLGLLDRCRELGIPSVFWNKEDPVHYARFVGTASRCDHVFTTDAGKLPAYLAAGVGRVRTVSALPFYAQPRIHNPLPGARPYEHTVAYAGTYYGDRYPQRSTELRGLLETAVPYGLSVYDRQADIPDSPYHFPPALRPYVRGALPYSEVIDSYKAHLANLNVNSVTTSPSMFSRRVVEVAACGGVVLSGPGRGVVETFGSAIPTSGDAVAWRALLRLWAGDSQARLAEAWLQMRAVMRSHTVDAALTLVARTAGLAVRGPHRPTWTAVVGSTDDTVLRALATQSWPPAQVVRLRDSDESSHELVSSATGILGDSIPLVVTTRTGLPDTVDSDWVGYVDSAVGRTWAEDHLQADGYGPWDRIDLRSDDELQAGDPIAVPTRQVDGRSGLVRVDLLRTTGDLDAALQQHKVRGLLLRVPAQPSTPTTPLRRNPDQTSTGSESLDGLRVLVAGHDLKFARRLLDDLASAGAVVSVDEWASHTEHDVQRSRDLLAEADVVFCEWALGNLEWYSQHVGAHQRLVVRVHLQELDRPYLARSAHENVDAYVFVGELIRQAAILGHGVPAGRSVVVPNYVDTEALARPKHPGAEHTLGIVGVVPQRKRLDLALDVLERLRAAGSEHRLRIKGKLPDDFPWMSARPQEKAWFDRQFARIDALNASAPGTVLFDGQGDDMAEWYRHVGVVLSVSDFESFHLTIPDGAASGSLPAVLAWDGADLIYPREWLSPTVEALVDRIQTSHTDAESGRDVVRQRFAVDTVMEALRRVIAPPPTA